MDVHTYRCIWFIAMSGWIENSKCFGNKLENGFEIKEKNGKGKFENERI